MVLITGEYEYPRQQVVMLFLHSLPNISSIQQILSSFLEKVNHNCDFLCVNGVLDMDTLLCVRSSFRPKVCCIKSKCECKCVGYYCKLLMCCSAVSNDLSNLFNELM